MKKIIFLSVFLIFLTSPALTVSPRVNVDLVGMTVAEFLKVVYDDTLGNDYVLEPEVMEDERRIGVRVFNFKRKENLATLLKSLGYRLETRAGVDYISSIKKTDDYDIFVYRPKFKAVSDLKSALTGILSGTFAGDKDRLIFKGSRVEIAKLKDVLKRLDKKQKEIVIHGRIYEVTTGKSDANTFSIIADLFRNAGLAVSNGLKMANYLSFNDKNVSAYWSVLSTDSRFKLISEPYLRVRSDSTAVLTVGNDVPTLGSVTYQDGQAVQNVAYRSSGIIFEISPQVFDDIINLDVRQELSNFSETTSGVNNSPTLVKREIKTRISARNAELIVLGGLTDDKKNSSKAGLSWLPDWLGSQSDSQDKTEIILSLHIEILPDI